MAKRMAISKKLKKIDVIFCENESYILDIKFYNRNGSESLMTQAIGHVQGRVETVEFAQNEHLLSVKIH